MLHFLFSAVSQCGWLWGSHNAQVALAVKQGVTIGNESFVLLCCFLKQAIPHVHIHVSIPVEGVSQRVLLPVTFFCN